MKLYFDPISTTSRPILLFLADHSFAIERANVSLLLGEHLSEAFAAINPNQAVPVLEDGDFRLNESSAILKYLADAAGSATYPRELKARAAVNSAMDWFNTGYNDFNHLYVYPQIFPMHAYESEATRAEMLARGLAIGEKRLAVLDRHMLAGRDFVCGDRLSIADYLGAAFVGLSEAIAFDLAPWPNVAAWMRRMKARPSWMEANAAFYGLIASHRPDLKIAS